MLKRTYRYLFKYFPIDIPNSRDDIGPGAWQVLYCFPEDGDGGMLDTEIR
jgi:hypothetical protein